MGFEKKSVQGKFSFNPTPLGFLEIWNMTAQKCQQ